MVEPPEDRPFDDGCDGLPVEPEVGGRRRPVQDPGQGGHGSGQGMGHPLPRLGPGDPLYAQPAAGAPDAAGGIHQLHAVLAHRQIPPPTLWPPRGGHPRGVQPTLPTAQAALPQAVDMDEQLTLCLPLFDLCHHVRFQSERFSDTRFPAHRLSASFPRVWLPEEGTRDARCASTFDPLAHLTLLGEEPFFFPRQWGRSHLRRAACRTPSWSGGRRLRVSDTTMTSSPPTPGGVPIRPPGALPGTPRRKRPVR